MSTTTVYLHHHSDFTSPPNVKYLGGKVKVIFNFYTDIMSFRDLEEFGKKYCYDANSLVYFKCDRHMYLLRNIVVMLFTVETDHIKKEDESERNTQEGAEKEFADDEDVGGQKEDVEDEGREEEDEVDHDKAEEVNV